MLMTFWPTSNRLWIRQKAKVKRQNREMLRLEPEHLDAIKAHAEADYPHECGGLLLGYLDAEIGKSVVETLPMENAADVERRHDRVLIEPRELMLADRKAREPGRDVVGNYDSPPDA